MSRPKCNEFQSPDRTARRLFPANHSTVEHVPSILKADRLKTFSEKLAERRLHDQQKEAKQERTKEARSCGFKVDRSDYSIVTDTAVLQSQSVPTIKALLSPQTSKKSLRSPRGKSQPEASSTLRKIVHSNEVSAASPLDRRKHPKTFSKPASRQVLRNPNSEHDSPSVTPAAGDINQASAESASFESFSGLHLSKRLLPHTSLARGLEGKELLTIPHLLKVVKSPEYDPPDIDGDYVVFGIIASKSKPRDHANTRCITSNAEDDDTGRSKFMVLRLTDLKWELDLFLFDSGFEQFWKLTPGTVIAVLNPGIMPPRPTQRDTGQFSLKLASSEDTVLEIGSAKHLGFCSAKKKDGAECGQWIDNRKTEVCEFHIYLQLEEAKKGRMQVNTMTNFGGRGGKGKGRGGVFAGKVGEEQWQRQWHDNTRHGNAYIVPTGHQTVALIDAEDAINSRGFSKSDMRQKRLAQQEKERELAKQLGSRGEGMGAEYARVKELEASSKSDLQTSNAPVVPSSDAALNLLGGRASDARLSPVNSKRGTASSSEPMGWGGAFKRDLLSPSKRKTSHDGEKSGGPIKKKARFMTSRGIKEPGRESLPSAEVAGAAAAEDEEDDLDIV